DGGGAWHRGGVASMMSCSSSGSIEMPVSGPGHWREMVKCFSNSEAPSAAAPRQVQMFIEWSDRPTGQSGNSRISSLTAPRRTLSYGVGYMDVQCISASGTPCRLIVSTERRIDGRSFIPVDRIIGLPNRAMWSSNGTLLHSPEPILNAGTPIAFSRSAASRENGVDRYMTPFLAQ